MVGRDQELQELATTLAAAADDHGGLLLLAGEAGVGKTSLAEAAIAASGSGVVRGAAVQGRPAPYAPVVRALRDSLRRDPSALDGAGPLRAQLAVLLPELGPLAQAPDRETLAEALRAAFESLARRAPTVVFLDDLQWADAATLELLPLLTPWAEAWPLLLLGAYRSDEIPRGHPLRRMRTELRRAGRLAELAVEPLGEAATGTLAGRVLGAEPGPMLRAALFDRTQGIPFFVEELAAALGDGSALVAGARGLELEPEAQVPIPDTVRDAVRLRREGLSPAAQGTLEAAAAAAAGIRVELDLLAQIAEEEGLAEVLEAGLLTEVEVGVGAFRHDLAREAVYLDTPWPRRRTLHRRLAEVLAAGTAEPSSVALHWSAAGEGERALPLLLEAAGRYCVIHAYRDAASAARAALELWPAGTDQAARLEVLEELGRCAALSGEVAEAVRSWEEVAAALEAPEDLRRIGRVRRRLGVAYQLQGGGERAVGARLAAAEAYAAAGLEAEAARDYLAAAELATGDSEAYLAHARAASEAARRAGETDLEARALAHEGLAYFQLGRRDEGAAAGRSALTLALAGKHVGAAVNAYFVLGTLANYWADYAAAEDAFAAAVDLCRENDQPAEEHVCLSCLALVLYNRGEWERAETLGRAVLASPAGEGMAQAHALVALGLVSAARGATKRARSLLRRAEALGRKLGSADTILQSSVGLAVADELEGVGSVRWEELVHLVPERVSLFYAQGLSLASTFAASREGGAFVQACADALATYAARFGAGDALAALAHALGEIAVLEGDPRRADEQFEQALEILREIDAPFDHARVQARAGAALAAAGEREAGVELLVDAYRAFRKLGARPFWLQAAAELESLGEPVERRLGRRAAADLERGGLTRRELEILRLVAVGRTNREIAHELFLSPRTVEMHVRHMLAKLGCRSRVEATGRAHELGLLGGAAAR
jgi:DNA-binding CsgD family transcriptional regulator